MMKKVMPLVLILATATVCTGEVFPQVYLADSNTPLPLRDPNIPFVYRDIMVGTKLTIIVDSNVAGLWEGGLFIADPYRDYGLLSGRDYNDVTLDWEGSRFEAAGKDARVYDWQDDVNSGFELYGHRTAVPGDWFIIDYTAIQAGQCKVGFYDYGGSGGINFPVNYLVFSHVPTRDFNKDTRVDLSDFAVLASYWLQKESCSDPGWCEGTDLDTNGTIDTNDLMLFTEYWLEKTE